VGRDAGVLTDHEQLRVLVGLDILELPLQYLQLLQAGPEHDALTLGQSGDTLLLVTFGLEIERQRRDVLTLVER